MPLSWNEIKQRTAAFVKNWEDAEREEADAKEFLIDFLNIFGITRRRVATFEHKVKKLDHADGYIDLLWKGQLLVEMKSRGGNLEKAYKQAKDYCAGLKDHELPKQIMISDFEHFVVYDESGEKTSFVLKDLLKHIQVFGSIAGYQKRTYKEQDPVNIAAAELMGKLHDKLKAIGYEGHRLELYLVRLVFCLFADDSNIFEKGIFFEYLNQKTREDGSDLAPQLSQLFEILNTPRNERLKNLDESLDAFPYVNGKLFEERLPLASFDSSMRKALLDCCALDWAKISPAIFGSLFQSVMDEKARRNLGAHYTSEKNILKLIKPLFLDELWAEYEKASKSKGQLQKLHDKISGLRFLDPACGCGNFLIIAYRELRLLEVEIIKQLLKLQGFREEVIREAKMDASYLNKCNVDQFYGIEYEEFPAQIARTAMWLMDHQMNMLVTETFGEYYVRLPLQKAATIAHGNALRMDWQSLLDKERVVSIYAETANVFQVAESSYTFDTVNIFAKRINDAAKEPTNEKHVSFDYILGNPPFIGSKFMNQEQRLEIENIFPRSVNAGVLDYVSGWYALAVEYVTRFKQTKVAFVSTNSICQGEQVGSLWKHLLQNKEVEISFAHTTFKWSNEAKGNAAVHVVIIGLSSVGNYLKKLFTYGDIGSEPQLMQANHVNPYLVDAQDVFITSRQEPLCNVPAIGIGNKPIDGGYYLFTEEEKEIFLIKEPAAKQFFKRWIGSQEFINGYYRWCLWLGGALPQELKSMPEVLKRIEAVRNFRLESNSKPTVKLADTPTRFHVERIPKKRYLVIPKVSSERRKYIPIGYLDSSVLSSDLLFVIEEAQLFHFGLLGSSMHMSWVRYTCGRLKSDYRYSKDIVYNNFPWPENPTEKQKQAVEAAAQKVLDTRALFPNSSLADLYDPNTMPPELVKAHQALDKAVDLCYRSAPFASETKRIEYLFELYDKYTSGMFGAEKVKSDKRKVKSGEKK